jgi:hypothetical protein
MSDGVQTPQAWARSITFPAGHRTGRALAAIAENCNEVVGYTYTSTVSIAMRAGIGLDQINLTLLVLERAGLIHRFRRYHPTGLRATDLIVLSMDRSPEEIKALAMDVLNEIARANLSKVTA